MSPNVETSVTAEDWAKAESLATEYVKREKNAKDPISFRRFEYAPFLVGCMWEGGEAAVLVYGDKIRPQRGPTALAPYFEFLGAARLRVLTPAQLDRILGLLAAMPDLSRLGRPWRDNFAAYPDLYPAVIEKDGVIKYVVHYLAGSSPPLPRTSSPPPGGPPPGIPSPGALPPPGGRPMGGGPPSGGGRVLGGPLVFQRWTLQLHPPVPDLDWKVEETFERPDPDKKNP